MERRLRRGGGLDNLQGISAQSPKRCNTLLFQLIACRYSRKQRIYGLPVRFINEPQLRLSQCQSLETIVDSLNVEFARLVCVMVHLYGIKCFASLTC